MSSLTNLIRVIPPGLEETPEDIIAAAPGFLYPDDLITNHGDRNDIITYESKRFGEIALQTADPANEEERTLFSHHLWNASVLMAERLSGHRLLSNEERTQWSLEGQNVLELGAGVGLAGIVGSLAGAREVVLSDYPAAVVLDNIRRNVEKNVPDHIRRYVHVCGHEWGVLDSKFAQENQARFNRLVVADCFWMPWQHKNLVTSMLHFLSKDPEARVFAIGGFHTGRKKLAAFFDVAEDNGLRVEDIYEEDNIGVRRKWAKENHDGWENVTERKRWLVIARLLRTT